MARLSQYIQSPVVIPHAVAANQDYNGTLVRYFTSEGILHWITVTQQLKDGIRLLQVQTHNLNGQIQLCHTSCVRIRRTTRMTFGLTVLFKVAVQWRNLDGLFGRRHVLILVKYNCVLMWLAVKTWMDANPNDGRCRRPSCSFPVLTNLRSGNHPDGQFRQS